MKLAISAREASLDAEVDPRFGRCPCFIIVDTESATFEYVDNTSTGSTSGSGIQAAQLVARHGVEAVLTGHCGTNAQQTLTAAKITILSNCSGTISEIVRRYVSGKLARVSSGTQSPEHT